MVIVAYVGIVMEPLPRAVDILEACVYLLQVYSNAHSASGNSKCCRFASLLTETTTMNNSLDIDQQVFVSPCSSNNESRKDRWGRQGTRAMLTEGRLLDY